MSDPILQRELIGLLRQRKTAWLQCGLAAALALLVALRWPTDPRISLSGSRSQEIFRLIAGGMLGAILLLLPVFPATSIVRERTQGTLALLLNSPLSPWRIFRGKLLATLGLAGLMLALSIPAAAGCYALGGVSLTRDLPLVYLVLALTALQCTALSLLISSYATTADAAVRWAYGAVLLLSVVTLVPYHLMVGSTGWTAELAGWLRCASPFAALLDCFHAADTGSGGIVASVNITSRFVLLSLLITVVCSGWTISRLNHRLFDRVRSTGVISDDRGFAARILRRFLFIVDPQRRSGAIGPLTSPVMIKEFRCRRFGRLHWLLRLVSGCAILSLALAILTTTRTVEWDVATIGAILVVLQVVLLVVITPSLTAGLISTERETGGWVLLQMTPMSSLRIVYGKLLSVTLTVLLILCATLPGYVVMVYLDPGLTLQVQRVVVCLAVTAVFGMLASAAAGCLFRRTAPATAAAYTLLLTVCGLPLLVWLGRDAPFGHDTVENALLINPIAATLTVIRHPSFRDYDLIPGNWWILGGFSAFSALVLLERTRRLSRPQ